MRALLIAKSFIFLNLFIVTIVGSQIDGTNQSQINFKFFDGNTGKAIQIDQLIFDSEKTTINLDKKHINYGKTVSRQLESGTYEIGIAASGYKALTNNISLKKNSTLRQSYYLRNLNPPRNISPEYVRSLHKKEGAVIVGYIVDENGLAISNAKIVSNDNEETVTDKNGYFQIFLRINNSSDDYAIKQLEIIKKGFKTDVRSHIVVTPFGDYIYKISLEEGTGVKTTPMSDVIIENGKIIGRKKDRGKPTLIKESIPNKAKSILNCGVPNSISVGYSNINDPDTDCVNNCPFSIIVDFELYVSEVLDNEWLTQWNTLNDIEEAYMAAAVAIRSFGSWRRVVSPRSNPNYHITNNTNDQAYVPGFTSWSMMYAAATEGTVVKSAITGNFISTNYAAETNNWPVSNSSFPCGNGYVINSVGNNQCIEDPVTFNHPFNGHGWNMGQWGSARWATGINLAQTIGSNSGPNHNHGKKTWQQILDHYYPSHNLCLGVIDDCPEVLVLAGSIDSGAYQASEHVEALGIINSSSNVTMTGGDFVEWNTGFDGRNGSVVIGEVSPCNN